MNFGITNSRKVRAAVGNINVVSFIADVRELVEVDLSPCDFRIFGRFKELKPRHFLKYFFLLIKDYYKRVTCI